MNRAWRDVGQLRQHPDPRLHDPDLHPDLLTWIPRVPYNRFLAAAIGFVTDVVDPYLNLFRRFLPPVRIGPGALDLSPIVGLVVLQIVGGLLVQVIRG